MRLVLLATLVAGIVNAGETNQMTGVHRIVFCGNSLTDGSAWCDWVIETLQANGYPNLIMFNAGVAGNVAQISGELEESLPGWKVLVGPQEAADLESFIKARLK